MAKRIGSPAKATMFSWTGGVLLAILLAGALHMADSAAVGDEPAKGATAQKAEKAAEPAGSAEKPAARTVIQISGNVVDEATGRTLPYFSVQGGAVDKKDPTKITWGFWGQERTSANLTGEFRLTLDWFAGQRARIVAGGYLSQPILTEPPKAGVTDLRGLVIAMKRGRQLSGHVFDYTGKPVKDAGVFVVGNPAINLTGGKAMQHLGPTISEDKKAGRVATDDQGAFTVTGIDGDAERIAVTCPALDVWVVPIPKGSDASQNLEIHLPQPGKLIVHYDVPGGAEKADIFMQLHTWEMPELKGVGNNRYEPIRQHVECVLDNLTPGDYTIDRRKDLGWEKPMFDRRTVKIESGKTTVTDFVRPKGAPVTGQVTGLDQFDVAKAIPPGVFVRIVSPQGDRWTQEVFDVVIMRPGNKPVDGKFTTERIAPGQYKVKAEAFLTGDMRSPTFVGEVPVTVPEEGAPEPVTISLSKRGAPK